MKRVFFLSATCVLAVAAMLWLPTELNAQRGHGGGGGGHFSARSGSVHYSGASFRHGPVGGSVRSEHFAGREFGGGFAGREFGGGFAGREFGGGYRNPYRGEYFRLFPPGYRSFLLGGAMYNYYDFLPPGCPPVLINGLTYYYCGGVYYQPYMYGGQTVYMAAPF